MRSSSCMASSILSSAWASEFRSRYETFSRYFSMVMLAFSRARMACTVFLLAPITRAIDRMVLPSARRARAILYSVGLVRKNASPVKTGRPSSSRGISRSPRSIGSIGASLSASESIVSLLLVDGW